MAWKSVKGETNFNQVWDFDLEPVIEGKLLEKKENVGPSESNMYEVETAKGIFSVWGTTVLDNRIEIIPVGSLVKIMYKGRKTNPKNGRSFKDFEVWIDE